MHSRISLRVYGFLILTAGTVWVLDQLTKAWIRHRYALGLGITLLDAPLSIRLIHWYNTGGVFGLLQGYSTLWAALALVITVLLVQAYPRVARRLLLRWGLALQLGGALGNLTDRLLRGHVTDFIAVGRFPVFNLADAAITVGIGLMLLDTLFHNEEPRPTTEANDTPPPNDSATTSMVP